MGRYSYNDWPPYVSVAQRRHQAAKKIAKMKKAGRDISPVEIEGRKIATTFWGEAWCNNLEAYSDYANRMPRGRTYVRNGSVVDLQIEAGRVRSLVSGSDLYKIDIKIKPLAKKRWADIKRQCGGRIDSLVELLMGSISKGIMEIVTRKGAGLFPAPRDISLSCSCPDWATMCKHVAATLYGVGARLDHDPKLLFTLRGVDPTEMVEAAVDQPPTGTGTRRKPQKARALDPADLSSVFGVDMEMDTPTKPAKPAKPTKRKRRAAKTTKKATRKKPTTRKKPATKKAAAKKPATKKAATKKPAAKKPATKKPAAKKAATKKPAAKKPAAKKPAAKKPAAKKPAAKKPATKKPAAKKASAKKASTRKKTPKGRPAAKKAGKKPKRSD